MNTTVKKPLFIDLCNMRIGSIVNINEINDITQGLCNVKFRPLLGTGNGFRTITIKDVKKEALIPIITHSGLEGSIDFVIVMVEDERGMSEGLKKIKQTFEYSLSEKERTIRELRTRIRDLEISLSSKEETEDKKRARELGRLGTVSSGIGFRSGFPHPQDQIDLLDRSYSRYDKYSNI